MSRADYAGFVHNCLVELSAIDQEITLLDPEIDKERINFLRAESLRIQLRADRRLSLLAVS